MKQKKPIPTWILVWVFFILLVAVMLIANREAIDNFLVTAGWSQSQESEAPLDLEILRQQDTSSAILLKGDQQLDPVLEDPETDENIQQYLPLDPVNPDNVEDSSETTSGTESSHPAENPPGEAKIAPVQLFFVNVSPEGLIELYPATRELDVGNSPLTKTIQELLKGPTPAELAKGYLSLIPENTKLLSARVTGDTAFLSFSEEFQFNSLGMEGYVSQLRQIIHTAVTIPPVKKVQFLINGTYKEVLGSEGIPISYPLTTTTFSP